MWRRLAIFTGGPVRCGQADDDDVSWELLSGSCKYTTAQARVVNLNFMGHGFDVKQGQFEAPLLSVVRLTRSDRVWQGVISPLFHSAPGWRFIADGFYRRLT